MEISFIGVVLAGQYMGVRTGSRHSVNPNGSGSKLRAWLGLGIMAHDQAGPEEPLAQILGGFVIFVYKTPQRAY